MRCLKRVLPRSCAVPPTNLLKQRTALLAHAAGVVPSVVDPTFGERRRRQLGNIPSGRLILRRLRNAGVVDRKRNCSAFCTSSPPLLIRNVGAAVRRHADQLSAVTGVGRRDVRPALRLALGRADRSIRAVPGGDRRPAAVRPRAASTRRRRCTTARATAEKVGSTAAAIQGRLSRWPSRASSDQSPGPISASQPGRPSGRADRWAPPDERPMLLRQ